MTDIDDGGLQVRLEQSNIPRNEWARYGPQIAEACKQNNIRPIDLDAYSLAGVYKLPGGESQGTWDFVLGVLNQNAIMMLRMKGMISKKLEVKFFEMSSVPGITFLPEDNPATSSWGSLDLQGISPGGQRLLRLGWGWSGPQQFEAAMQERARFMNFLP